MFSGIEIDHEFSDEHTFIILQSDGKEYVFDPMNPTETNQGKFPSIYDFSSSFTDTDLRSKKKFLEGTNVINKSKAYYGVNNHTNIDFARDVQSS